MKQLGHKEITSFKQIVGDLRSVGVEASLVLRQKRPGLPPHVQWEGDGARAQRGPGSRDANFLPLRMNLKSAYLLKGKWWGTGHEDRTWGQDAGTGVEPDRMMGSKVSGDEEVQGTPRGLFTCW